MVLVWHLNVTIKIYLAGRLKYDLIRFVDNYALSQFFCGAILYICMFVYVFANQRRMLADIVLSALASHIHHIHLLVTRWSRLPPTNTPKDLPWRRRQILTDTHAHVQRERGWHVIDDYICLFACQRHRWRRFSSFSSVSVTPFRFYRVPSWCCVAQKLDCFCLTSDASYTIGCFFRSQNYLYKVMQWT